MKNICLYSMIVLLSLSAVPAIASDQNLSAREQAEMEQQIRGLAAAVEDMRAEINEQARLRWQERNRINAGSPCYGRGHHSYDGCRGYRHHF